MSVYIDVLYLKRLSNRLTHFKQKSEFLWNCRCEICGDGSHNKARGYFFKYNNKLFYKCHHCSASMTFGQFLKQFDPLMYGEYAIETFAEENVKPPTLELDVVETFSTQGELISIAIPLSMVDNENPAKQYCIQRKIPETAYSRLWYIEHTKDIVNVFPKYDKRFGNYEEPRLLIPFYSIYSKKLVGVTMRALDNDHKRYIMAKGDNEEPEIFGWDVVDKTKQIIVVEGPIDSLFLENAIAVGGTSFEKIKPLNLLNPIIVFDNQPRNKEVCKLIEKFVVEDYNVCIWPYGIKEKDINEMVLAGLNPTKIIQENTYKGLIAQIKYNEWRNC